MICGLTSSLSPFAIGEEITTAISLMDFQASREGGQVVIRWETQSEIDNWGFRILRSESATGPFVPLNNELIPARGGLGLSISYNYTDASAEPGKQYYYKLQDIDTRGLLTAHNAVALQEPGTVASSAGAVSTSARQQADAEQATDPAGSEAVIAAAAVSAYSMDAETVAGREHTPALPAMAGNTDNTLDDQSPSTLSAESAPAYADAAAVLDEVVEPLTVMDNGLTGREAVMDEDSSTVFSVTIKDDQGHVIDVSRVAEATAGEAGDATQLTVSSSGNDTVISWQAGRLHARGFALYRAPSGKDDYQPLMAYIPNYGEEDHALYQYRFTDHDSQTAGPFAYRLEVLSWGLKTVNSR